MAEHYTADKLDWALSGMMVPHSAIRLGLQRFKAAIESFQTVNKNVSVAKAELLKSWYNNYFYPFVHHHHDIEETNYFPWLQKLVQERSGGKASVNPQHNVEHVDLLKQLEEFKVDLHEFVIMAGKGTGATMVPSLVTKISTFCKYMDDHLNVEERDVCPLLREYIKKEENDAKETEIVQSLGLGGAKMMLPWIIEAMNLYDTSADKKFATNFYYNIPPPLRLFMYCNWTGVYERDNKFVIEGLAQGEISGSAAMCDACKAQ